MASQFERVHRRLIDEGLAGVFPRVSFDADLKAIVGPDNVAPAEVIANEISVFYDERTAKNHRTLTRAKRNWMWQLIVGFSGAQISTELFEKKHLEHPIIIPRDDANGLEQVTLHLQSADIRHPPHKEPSKGSRITFTFEARLSPR